jgi:DNA-binding LytR/AlgR family response regulator
MPHKVVIVDDEPLAIKVLACYLDDESDFILAAQFTNPLEALRYLKAHGTALLFLDIQMAALSGLEVMKQLQQEVLVVLTTAHKAYLQDGFDHGVLDYLQKPIRKERFAVAVERARNRLQPGIKAPKKDLSKSIRIKSTQKEISISIHSILFIQAVKDYCLIFLDNQTKVMAAGHLKTFVDKHGLADTFVRTHKSYIVPRHRIRAIKAGGVILIDQHEVPIGRMYKKMVQNVFQNNL